MCSQFVSLTLQCSGFVEERLIGKGWKVSVAATGAVRVRFLQSITYNSIWTPLHHSGCCP